MIGEVMQFTMKFLILIFIVANLSGCAGLYSCSRISDNPSAFLECQAKNGNPEAQYQMGLTAFNEGKIDNAVKWLKKAAKPRDNRTPIFIPSGNSGNVKIRMEETGLSKPGHFEAQQLLNKINEEDK